MAVDWLKIRSDYINGGGSYRALAVKYGISPTAICNRAKKESWQTARKTQLDKTCTKVEQKTAERISDEHADALGHISHVASRVVDLAERIIEQQEDVDVDTLSKVAKILKDAKDTQLGILPPKDQREGVTILDDLA